MSRPFTILVRRGRVLSACPIRRIDDPDDRHGKSARGEIGGDSRGECVHAVAWQQGDHRAAEASPCHPRADGTGVERRLDRLVELRAGHLVVVAQRPVGRDQQIADLIQTVASQQVDSARHAVVFGDDMPDAGTQLFIRKSLHDVVKIGHVEVAEPAHAQYLRRPLA